MDSSLAAASVVIAVLAAVLATYSWGRRREPGARELAIASSIAVLWALASLVYALSADPEDNVRWYGVTIALLLPMVCAVTAFVVHYAGLGHHLTRRRVWAALVVPSVADVALVLSNPAHGLVWSDAVVAPGGAVRVEVGVLGWVGLGYYTLLGLLNITMFLRIIVISPRRRTPAALMLAAHLGSRYAFTHEVFGWDLPLPLSPAVLTVGIPFATYALALFGLHVFDPVPAARRAALEQMSDGVVVADASGAVIEANPAAVAMLGRPVAELRGERVGVLLGPVSTGSEPGGTDPGGNDRFLVDLGEGDATRHHVVVRSTLTDDTGAMVGHLYLMRDVTEQRQAQDALGQQLQAVARLTEREHLARDLHDSVGQVLGFVSMQTQAIRKRLGGGEVERADEMLARLAEVAQQAHADVRGLILSLTSSAESGAAPPIGVQLAAQLRDFQVNHGIRADLAVGEGVPEDPFDATTRDQVLRVVQEALTNVRRHAGATTVRVAVTGFGDRIRLTLEDDGHGFDPRAAVDSVHQFGLANMRERMGDVGGTLRVESAPGRGTRVTVEMPVVTVEMPVRREEEA